METGFSDNIRSLKPLRNPHIQWQRNGTWVLLMLPWPKGGRDYKHIRPIDATGIAQVVILKPLIDEIWVNCDGEQTVLQIYEGVKARYPEIKALTFDHIASRITMLIEKRWLVLEGACFYRGVNRDARATVKTRGPQTKT